MYIIKEVRTLKKTKKKIVSFFSYFLEMPFNVRVPIMTDDIDKAKNFETIEQAEEIGRTISPQCRAIENPYLLKTTL